jgi:predicted dehydrogenase
MNKNVVQVGVVGLGGFGKAVLNAVSELEAEGIARLAAVCEPDTQTHAGKIAELAGRGVKHVCGVEEMCRLPVQAIWMPVPIPLHRRFTEMALDAGKWVLCEKPAAGSIQDVDAMIAARDRSAGKAAIAFQDIHEPSTGTFKQRLLSGEMGRIITATVVCCWPRDSSYFGRNNWAGKLKTGDTWVLDSPCMNAMAHSLNLPLFLMGSGLGQMAQVQAVEAELYRARDITSADTCCIRASLADGAALTCYMTHACGSEFGPEITIKCERGSLLATRTDATFRFADGRRETVQRDVKVSHSLRNALAVWTGAEPGKLLCSLEMARQQVLVVNAAFDAAAVRTIPASQVQAKPTDHGILPYVPGIEDAMKKAAEGEKMLHQAGLPWTSPAGKLDLKDYRSFSGRHA